MENNKENKVMGGFTFSHYIFAILVEMPMKIKDKDTIPFNEIHRSYCLVAPTSFDFIGLVLSNQTLSKFKVLLLPSFVRKILTL